MLRGNNAEDRVFGSAPFVAYPMVNRNVYSKFTALKSKLSVKLIVMGLLTAVSTFIIFLLGVNITIQYRTIRLNMKLQMFKKLIYIAFSIIGILQIVNILAWLVDNWNIYNYKNRSDRTSENEINHVTRRRGGYERLQN